MTHDPVRTVLVTGANGGIGKDVARQLASRSEIVKVYLACRNEGRARVARRELERATGRSIFEVVVVDLADAKSAHSAAAQLDGPVDALVMNAGGSGGTDPGAVTADGVTAIFATNVLGHVVLCEELIGQGKLTRVAVLAGSEAARGIPKFRMRRPTFASSSEEEFATVIDGTFSGRGAFDGALAYGQVKYLGALWMAALARRHPGLRFLTISPGNTTGTGVADDLPLPQRLVTRYVMPAVGPVLGLAHGRAAGAARLVAGVTDPTLTSGVFYASRAGAVTGPVADQADIVPDLGDAAVQDHAYDAIHRFLP